MSSLLRPFLYCCWVAISLVVSLIFAVMKVLEFSCFADMDLNLYFYLVSSFNLY